ncbi:MAG: hypothetical protein K0R98_338 [Rickettsiaceae bacterium]|jgi:hypothetical protein|nr:hypothetical protein [Rickettsiaceae bacterium]
MRGKTKNQDKYLGLAKNLFYKLKDARVIDNEKDQNIVGHDYKYGQFLENLVCNLKDVGVIDENDNLRGDEYFNYNEFVSSLITAFKENSLLDDKGDIKGFDFCNERLLKEKLTSTINNVKFITRDCKDIFLEDTLKIVSEFEKHGYHKAEAFGLLTEKIKEADEEMKYHKNANRALCELQAKIFVLGYKAINAKQNVVKEHRSNLWIDDPEAFLCDWHKQVDEEPKQKQVMKDAVAPATAGKKALLNNDKHLALFSDKNSATTKQAQKKESIKPLYSPGAENKFASVNIMSEKDNSRY